MIIYYAVILVSFFIIGLFIRLNRTVFQRLAQNSVALVDGLIAETDDEQKIKQVQKKTNNLVLALLKMFLILILAFALGAIPIAIYCIITGINFNSLDFSSYSSILVLSIGATIPFIIPLGKKKKSSYSELSQLLHRMALDNYYLANRLFKRETKKIRKKNLKKRDDFIIVSGLARAGTTSLMNDLSKIDSFVSLNYGNMPFLMCPNIWRKFYKPKTGKLKERSHKDGIMIGYNSNEALEEYFFKVKAHDSYIHDECLSEYEVPQQDYDDYVKYQTIIKLNDHKTYLAKNNNFILRYNSIRKYNENFLMIIMFREPLTHAASLYEKHQEYKKNQEQDPFVLEYMNWLGHHEFGKGQKFFRFNNMEYSNPYNKTTLNYWIQNWIYYYNFVLKINHHNTLLVNYEWYCNQPKSVINAILDKAGITANTPDLSSFNNKRNTNFEYDKALYNEAQNVYQKLVEKSGNPC